MLLSQTNGPLLPRCGSVKETIARMREAGFTCVDISFFNSFLKGSPYFEEEYRKKIVREYREALAEYGVTPVQSHEPTSNAIGDDDGGYYYVKACCAMPMAGEIGCRSYTVHPGKYNDRPMSKDEFISKNVASIGRLIPMAEKYGMPILVENLGYPGEGSHTTNADELIELVDAFDHPLVAANWDVGHGNLYGNAPYESIVKLGKRLKGIHVHDNRGFIPCAQTPFKWDLHLPPFMGNIDFEAVMRALKDVGYEGTLNFEIGYPVRPFLDADMVTEQYKLLYKSGEKLLEYYESYK